MAYKIQKEHFPLLEKLSQLFFETQKLQALRYILLPNTKVRDMKNYLLGFSDGSLNFSTSCIYLVSCGANSDKCRRSLINTMSKLAEDTQINKTTESIPDKEMHGLWLEACYKIKVIQDIKEAKIPIEAAYLGVDTLSQVVGLMKLPHVLTQKINKREPTLQANSKFSLCYTPCILTLIYG